ncbi:MAG: serine/threonine-protein kinase, partial [Gammaproteobacteria bacterium]
MPKIDHARWKKLSPFLDEVLEREGEERVGWIEALRDDHADVAQDLQSLLGGLQSFDDRGFLQSNPFSALLNEPSLEGQTLGAYTLESLLGRGGMGTVWLARRHDGHFEGKVAVKLLNLALLGLDGGQERFRREGRVLGRLAHPNIARILDAGVTPTGQLYLVLEYVEGSDIERYCNERSLTTESRIQLFLHVLEAVGHAHANLIVHRDIKPSNIYVTHQGVVKLLDFGVAKLLESDDKELATQLTREGMHALTPQYAAPEQLLDAPITVATDVYALGVLLYVLLSGQHPTSKKSSSTLQH